MIEYYLNILFIFKQYLGLYVFLVLGSNVKWHNTLTTLFHS